MSLIRTDSEQAFQSYLADFRVYPNRFYSSTVPTVYSRYLKNWERAVLSIEWRFLRRSIEIESRSISIG